MRKEKFFKILGSINVDYIEEAKTKKPVWKMWQKRVVRLGIFVGLFVIYQIGRYNADVQEVGNHGIRVTEDYRAIYHNITQHERYEFGIPLDYVPDKEDLGKHMGFVFNIEWASYKGLNGFKVYRSAKHPEKDSLRIVETRKGYYYFVCDSFDVDVKVGKSSNELFSTYEVPRLLEKMELRTKNPESTGNSDKYLSKTITDVGDEVIEILSGKVNRGKEVYHRHQAEVWYDTYGNDNVYYNEEIGFCTVQEKRIPHHWTSERNAIMDQAYELWGKGSRIIRITTERGFTFDIEYEPILGYFKYHTGGIDYNYYELADADVKKLNELLQITDF